MIFKNRNSGDLFFGCLVFSCIILFMQSINYLDSKTISFIDSIRIPLLNKFFIVITYFGEGGVVLFFTVVITIFLLIKKKKKLTLVLWLMFGGSVVSVYILKYAIHRPRPIGGMIEETSFSFPSAHTVIAIFFYTFIAYLFWRGNSNKTIKFLAFSFATVLIILIGFSRLYLGVHFLSDVLAGYLLGAVWLFLGIKLFRSSVFKS